MFPDNISSLANANTFQLAHTGLQPLFSYTQRKDRTSVRALAIVSMLHLKLRTVSFCPSLTAINENLLCMVQAAFTYRDNILYLSKRRDRSSSRSLMVSPMVTKWQSWNLTPCASIKPHSSHFLFFHLI